MFNRVRKSIMQLACVHANEDGTSALEFVRPYRFRKDLGMGADSLVDVSVMECKRCGKEFHVDVKVAKTEKPDEVFESSTLNDAYTDRNAAVLGMAKLALQAGLVVGAKYDDPEWPIVFIELPTGQVSWHIPIAEIRRDLPMYAKTWDGHTLEEKRQHMAAWLGWH